MSAPHRVYLIPGMFGFARLAGYDYFSHIERAVEERFERAGVPCDMRIVPTPPTASIRRRARMAADAIYRDTDGDDGPIHLVGHSTGGLDARLLASPSAALELRDERLAWRHRVRTVTSINTPHYGTPLASFFATVSGTHLLYALSLLTVTTLSFGGPPLTAASALVAGLGRLDKTLGVRIDLLDHTTDLLLRFIGEQGREEVRLWLEGIRQDQGGIIQITPEGMDMFTASVDDADDVRYGCLATASPPPGPRRLATSIRSPYAALSATIYSTLYAIAARPHPHYPFPEVDADAAATLEAGIGRAPSERLNDGVVPTLSMLWGKLLWAGQGDHLDVMGHFHDDDEPAIHTDWLTCGAHFGRHRFGEAMDALARFLLDD
ncbi:MAG: esterase/lipase family protein [Myxococcota bacterium]